jgi:glycine oxidase
MQSMIIVGGGIAGLSVGWRLAQRGLAVTVLDAGDVGSGASHAAAGYLEPSLEPDPLSAFEWESLRAFPGFAAALEAETGMDVDFRRDGQLRIAYRDGVDALRAEAARRRAAGWQTRFMDGDEARSLEPALSPEVAAALLLPEVTWVDGRKLCAALAEAIRRRGGRIVTRCRVTGLIERAGTTTGVTTQAGAVEGDGVLLAAGWRTDAIPGLPAEIPACEGLRGVILTLAMDPAAPLIRHIVKRPDGVLLPRSDGRLIVGVTRDAGRFDPEPDAGSILSILGGAVRAVPACADLPFIEAVCRFRPYLEGGTMLLGPSRERAGLFYALGYGANGYLRCAAGSARICAEIMRLNETPAG